MDESEKFMQELIALCEKHKMAVVPTYEGKVSAHDPMRIVPLDNFWLKYLNERVHRADEV